jgi:hypothetical protein
MNDNIINTIDDIKNFEQFLNDGSDFLIKIKDIILIPQELNDIFDICKNEINLSNEDISITQFYSKILIDCLLQYNNLTYGEVDIISNIKNFIVKSENEREVKFQYKQLTKPSHILSAILLKMLTDYKKINFIDEKLKKFHVFNVMMNFIIDMITNKSHYSNSFKRKLLNSKIKVD